MSPIDFHVLSCTELALASKLMWDSFTEFEAPSYPPQGVSLFRQLIDPAILARQLSSGEIVFTGAFNSDSLVGVIGVRGQNHVVFLFVDKVFHRQGLGCKLFEWVCADWPDTKQFTVNSSPYAVGFYKRLGFIPAGQEQERDGIRFTPMLWSRKMTGEDYIYK